ncbi:ethylene-responsive transcription factor WRI1-like [Phoenix dactylifera]|uniref:Ethylene-responsive transcription factor WRI1-like n=1 Tax=Phoenix dactylifera TaxID=42345 RepID=A0A8B9AYU3_PHODC|nr:ethylene-responsive transcription factor WRI1-like [Phoenix dactylifera]
MEKSPPSPPLPSSRSSCTPPSNHAPLSSPNVIPVNKPKSKSKSKPKHKKVHVIRHRWTGRFEAHLWDKNWQHPVQNKRGRQVYLGAYDAEADAARAHDRAALKFCGPEAILNFPVETYREESEEMQAMSKEELVASLRRRSDGFARGVSKYRGVARHHHNGRWEARLGLVLGYKYLYLGTYETQEEAAQAYDLAALQFKGPDAVTNFDSCLYVNYPRPCVKLPPRPQISPPQEPRVGPMEPRESIDQTVPSEDIWDAITWSTIGMDISNHVGFEGDIEQLFEGFETFSSGASEGSLEGEIGQDFFESGEMEMQGRRDDRNHNSHNFDTY